MESVKLHVVGGRSLYGNIRDQQILTKGTFGQSDFNIAGPVSILIKWHIMMRITYCTTETLLGRSQFFEN